MNMTIGELEKTMLDDLDEYCSDRSLCNACVFFNGDETNCIHSGDYTIDDLFDRYKQLLNECPSACSIPYDEFFKLAAPLTATTVEITNYDDMVNHPGHYTHGGIECIDAQIAAFGEETVTHFCLCNCMKYLWRHEHKGGKIDCEKALWYLNKYMELKYGNLEEN